MFRKLSLHCAQVSDFTYYCIVRRRIASKDHLTFIKEVKSKMEKPEGLRRKTDHEKIGLGGYLLLAIPITTLSLGVWQIKRKTWKENLIKHLEENMSRPIVSLPENLDDLDRMEYHTVSVNGYFLHDREMFMGPRSLITAGQLDQGGGLITQQQDTVGYHVITPFKLDNREEIILINRGWVALNRKEAIKRPEGQVKGLVSLTGVVRHQENRPQFTSEHRNNIFFYRDVFKMSRLAGTEPVFLDATANSTIPGGPIGGQTRVSLRNEHLSYIITWFSLSAFTSWLWYTKIYKRIAK